MRWRRRIASARRGRLASTALLKNLNCRSRQLALMRLVHERVVVRVVEAHPEGAGLRAGGEAGDGVIVGDTGKLLRVRSSPSWNSSMFLLKATSSSTSRVRCR